MTQQPIDALCTQIQSELKTDPQSSGVAALLASYAKEHQDWRDYQVWNPDFYTRNLVHRCAAYEMLLLCWQPGQKSPIHGHSGQQCWMAVLEGKLEEKHFAVSDAGPVEGRRAAFGNGEVAFINDEIAWHQISSPGEGRSVSLHLYANPIDSCRIIDEESKRSAVIEMGYHSVRGRECDVASAAEVRSTFV